MKTEILAQRNVGDMIEVTFRYWEDRACACTAKKAVRIFEKYPTESEIVRSI